VGPEPPGVSETSANILFLKKSNAGYETAKLATLLLRSGKLCKCANFIWRLVMLLTRPRPIPIPHTMPYHTIPVPRLSADASNFGVRKCELLLAVALVVCRVRPVCQFASLPVCRPACLPVCCCLASLFVLWTRAGPLTMLDGSIDGLNSSQLVYCGFGACVYVG